MRDSGKKILFAAVIAIASIPVGAIPITFELGGTIVGESVFDLETGQTTVNGNGSGQAFTARFVVETDALHVLQRADEIEGEFALIRDIGPTVGVQSFLSIGGVAIDTTPFEFENSYVQYVDSHGLIPECDDSGCYSFILPDNWIVGARSSPTNPIPGAAIRNMFFFQFAEPFDSAVPGSGTTWLDFSQSTSPDLLATLPWAGMPGLTFQRYVDSTRTSTGFNVTSFSRTVSSVPEPGALGLFAAGLLGVFAARRRRNSKESPVSR